MAFNKKETYSEYLKLSQDLKSGDYKPYYLMYGSEEYLKLSYKKAFRKAFGGEEGMAYTYFDGAPDVDELIDLLNTIPFTFGENNGRLVIVSDSQWFKKTPPEKLVKFLEDIEHYPDTAHLMFIEDTADKRGKLYKIIQKNGFACEVGEQDHGQLGRWAARYLTNAGKKIRSSTMDLVLMKAGTSMDNIASELEKLIAYTGEREIIEDEDVETICSQNVEDRVFDMITEMSLGNTEKALKYYADLLTLQEAPMKILSLMRRNFNQLLLTKESVTKGMTGQEAAKFVGVSPWILGKLQNQAKHYTLESLEAYISRSLDYDEAIKSGNLSDRIAVELLLTV
ncbi:DNA polymerase III subunit delta [Oribacterium sp. WCC10]|uniref:DNA polymerase III subunit delta n=1 Tax=Oribacterium sp. WCC10 TaxID=1855343 RepID=UPI0008ECF9F2|nr:DNA polymerase III subunit delta [Oribacterium sp. WCC10]SFG39102.1 DNA polymerase III, delta subunit [Oribacterium sp. WCC10]